MPAKLPVLMYPEVRDIMKKLRSFFAICKACEMQEPVARTESLLEAVLVGARQYLFRDEAFARASVERVAQLLRPGGRLIGVVPDAAKVLLRACPDIDVPAHAGSRGPRFGELVDVYLRDCPYYEHGVVAEPLCYRELLVALCAAARLRLLEWVPFHAERTGAITDTYVTFVFEKEDASEPA